jgi:hypothetical protein
LDHACPVFVGTIAANQLRRQPIPGIGRQESLDQQFCGRQTPTIRAAAVDGLRFPQLPARVGLNQCVQVCRKESGPRHYGVKALAAYHPDDHAVVVDRICPVKDGERRR